MGRHWGWARRTVLLGAGTLLAGTMGAAGIGLASTGGPAAAAGTSGSATTTSSVDLTYTCGTTTPVQLSNLQVPVTLKVTAPKTVTTGSKFTVSSEASVSLPSSLSSTLSKLGALGVTGVQVTLVKAGVAATNVTPTSQADGAEGLPLTLSLSQLTSPITTVLTPLTFTAGSTAATATFTSTALDVTTVVQGGLLNGTTAPMTCTANAGNPPIGTIAIVAPTPAPTITSFTPTSGLPAGGTKVTVTGTNLCNASAVDFGTTTVSSSKFSVSTGCSTLTVTSPPTSTPGPVTLSVTTPGGVATSSTQFDYLAAPTITSFTPTSGPTGTVVAITGTGFTGASAVEFGSVPASKVVVSGDTSIAATAPAQSTADQAVALKVTAAGGSVTSSATFQYTTPAPTITSFSPTSGSTDGGTKVVITGTNLCNASAVRFDSAVANAAAASASSDCTSLTVLSPPHGIGKVPIMVTTPGGSVTSSSDFAYVEGSPTITSFTPTSGPVSGGTKVTVTGTNLCVPTAISFGSYAFAGQATANATCTTLTIASPQATSSGPVAITVQTASGSATSTQTFDYTAVAPTVTSFTPTAGAPGTSVTITGTDFTGASNVYFGTTAVSSFTVKSDTEITTTVPSGLGTTPVTISVENAGNKGTSTGTFTPTTPKPSAPTVTGISPSSGSTAGGATVRITGTNLCSATVAFGSTTVAASDVTANTACTQLTVVTPAGSAGAVTVTVTTAGGSATSSFTYTTPTAGAPTVTGISPTSGPSVGGDPVSITGTGFTVTSSVVFGTTPAEAVTFLGTTQLIAISPPGTGTVPVTVANSTGTSVATAADQFTYVGAPTISSINPTSGTQGTQVTITGQDLANPLAVFFGANLATIVPGGGSTTLTVVAPSGAGQVPVYVMTASGISQFTSPPTFSYVAVPTVSGVSPTQGPTTGGSTVTVTGTGFTGATGVHFGTVAATNVKVTSDTTLTAVSPAGEGTVDVTVTGADGQTSATVSHDRFTYVNVPSVFVVYPATGPGGGGNTVDIFGSGFTGATGVSFGTTAATSFSVVNDNWITAVAPAGTGKVDITVSGPGGTTSVTSSADRYTYLPAPKVMLVFPPVAPANSGYRLTFIIGSNLSGATSVTFGSTPAPFVPVSSAVIMAFAPPEAAGTVDVKVTTTTGGTSATSHADHFTYEGTSGAS